MRNLNIKTKLFRLKLALRLVHNTEHFLIQVKHHICVYVEVHDIKNACYWWNLAGAVDWSTPKVIVGKANEQIFVTLDSL